MNRRLRPGAVRAQTPSQGMPIGLELQRQALLMPRMPDEDMGLPLAQSGH